METRELARRALALLAAVGAACAAPVAPGGAPRAPARLYVAHALGDTVAQLDAPTGRPLAFGAPAGRALLAAAGGRYAVVAYTAADADLRAPRCRLTLVDVPAGAVVGTATVCRPGERVDAVALAGGPADGAGGGAPGPVAYLAIRPLAPAAPGLPGGAAPRVVAVAAATGRVLAGLPLDGAPSHLVLAPEPGGAGARLYGVETLAPAPGPDGPDGAYAGRLLGLDPATLEVRSTQPLTRPPLALAVGPDGARAYALVGRGDPARGDALTELDLAAGTARPFATLPEGAVGLAVTAARVYASAPTRDVVWALDRRTGQPIASLAVGRGPAGLTLGPPR